MNFLVNKKKLKINHAQFMRQAGYGFIIDRRTGNETFARNLGREHYPRFHMYIKEDEEKIKFSLHLDQKKTSYAGAHAHSAEYDSPVVKAEIERLKNMLRKIYLGE
ncbi:hypothetical protein KAU09_03845 [Candidatus Parcubacteria bacterium]|nr:hypothetical protein [Candidatus Parcubacteria bacterium]